MRWIILLYLLVLPSAAYASPEITSWYNNKTDNTSLYISVAAEDAVLFNVSANETIDIWSWKLNGNNQINNNYAWTYTFPSYSTYYVSVSGSNANGSTQTVNWTITSTLMFTDALGNNVSINKKPEKIVSLAPSNTEILFALGIGNRVIGVTDYCDYPPEAKTKTSVGGFYNPNVEVVESLGPDLILAASGNDITVVNKLIQDCVDLNCTVVGFDPKTIEEVIEDIKLVGKIADVNAGNLTLEITQRMDAVESNTSGLTEEEKLKVFYVIWYPELYTGGNGTFAGDLIQKAGGNNIASDFPGWYAINKEKVLSRNPEVIICSSMGSGTDICNNLKNDASLKYVDAVVNNSLYVIGDPDIVELPGPRIASGLETIHAILNFPKSEVNATSVEITSPQATSYEPGSIITLSYASNASISVIFYSLDSGFITSFENEATTVFPGSGSHTITFWARDANGNWGSDTLSFTIKSPPQQSSGGGGSAPPTPTVTASSGKATVTLPYVGADNTVSMQIPSTQSMDVTEVSIKAKTSISSAQITIKSLETSPSDIPKAGGEAYRHLEITKQNIEDEKIEDLIIKFKVERSWITGNKIDEKTIKLKRYNNGQWAELPTDKSKEDPTYLYFTARSPGFSYFAIVGEKALASTISAPVETSSSEMQTPTTAPPTVPPVVTTKPPAMAAPLETPVPTTAVPARQPKGICGPTAVLAISIMPMILYRVKKKN